ncbi:MAG: phytanoyl-CoA dioxygenase family protein [Planctomycetes bacterium]|nr:phytanoyl-CoA dioxygenase family protein [Planctomycetota bacterium]
MPLHPLRPDQTGQFLELGYVLASGLIPKEAAAKADRAAFRCNGFEPGDPTTWAQPPKGEFFDDPDLMALYTDALLAAGAQLTSNPYLSTQLPRPESAFVIKILPAPGPWKHVNAHIDGSYENPPLLSFPRQWDLFAMIYLHDIEPQSGGTVLWPRTHRFAEALIRSQPTRFKFLRELRPLVEELAQKSEPVELQPKAGDVLFFHPWTVHSKPMNCGTRPRFAMNCKW